DVCSSDLEGSLRDVDVDGVPEAEEESLHGLLHVELLASEDMKVADLRDPQLDGLGLKRPAISSSPSQHYPCTLVSRSIDQSISPCPAAQLRNPPGSNGRW